MRKSVALVVLAVLYLPGPTRAGEILVYKGAKLIRQEEHGMMVFEVKDGEIKAQPSLNMKGIDQNGKVYSSGFAAAEKHEHAAQLLKIGNVVDLKINKVNAKTFIIAEVRLVKGEVLPFGARNKVVKPGQPGETNRDTRPDDQKAAEAARPTDKPKTARSKTEKRSYQRATIKKYDNGTVTFEFKGEEIVATVPRSFKAIDRNGRPLKPDDRLRVFREGNEAAISTRKVGTREVIMDVRLKRGSLADR